MATFGQWLDNQAGRQDDIGIVAMAWKGETGRPRLSGVKSISEHVAERVPEHVLPAGRVNQALLRAGYEYREVNAGRTPLAAVPSVDAQPPGGEAVTMEQPTEPGPATMAALGRIERMIAGLYQELQPLIELARDVQAQGEQATAESDQAAWAGQPPAETHEAWLAEGQPEAGAGIAEQAMAAGVPAAVPQAPPGIYGATPAVAPVPEPNWAALAQQASPDQAG